MLPLAQTFAEKLLALRHQLSDATPKEALFFGTIVQRAKSGRSLLTAETPPAAALASPRRGIGALLRRAVAVQKAAANFGAAAAPGSVSAATSGAATSAPSSAAGRSEVSSTTADTARLLPGHVDSSPPSATSPRSACDAGEVASPPAATAAVPGAPALPAQAGAAAETGLPLLHQAAAPGSASAPAEPAGPASGGGYAIPAPGQAPAAAPSQEAQLLELPGDWARAPRALESVLSIDGDRAREPRALESMLSIDDWAPEQFHTLLPSAAGSQQEAEQPSAASADAAPIQSTELLGPQPSEGSGISRPEVEGRATPSQVVLERGLSIDGPGWGPTSPTSVAAGLAALLLHLGRPMSGSSGGQGPQLSRRQAGSGATLSPPVLATAASRLDGALSIDQLSPSPLDSPPAHRAAPSQAAMRPGSALSAGNFQPASSRPSGAVTTTEARCRPDASPGPGSAINRPGSATATALPAGADGGPDQLQGSPRAGSPQYSTSSGSAASDAAAVLPDFPSDEPPTGSDSGPLSDTVRPALLPDSAASQVGTRVGDLRPRHAGSALPNQAQSSPSVSRPSSAAGLAREGSRPGVGKGLAGDATGSTADVWLAPEGVAGQPGGRLDPVAPSGAAANAPSSTAAAVSAAVEPVRRPGSLLVPVLSVDRAAGPLDAAPGVAPGLDGAADHLGEASAVLPKGGSGPSGGAPQSARVPGSVRNQPGAAPAGVPSQRRTAPDVLQPAGSGGGVSPRRVAPASARGAKASATARGPLRPGSAKPGGPALTRQAPPAWPPAATVSLHPVQSQTPQLQGSGAAFEQLSAQAVVEQQSPGAAQMPGQPRKIGPARAVAPPRGGPSAHPEPQLPADPPAAPGSTLLATSDRPPAASAASQSLPMGEGPAGSGHAAKQGPGRQPEPAATVGRLEQAVRLPRLKLPQPSSGGPSMTIGAALNFTNHAGHQLDGQALTLVSTSWPMQVHLSLMWQCQLSAACSPAAPRVQIKCASIPKAAALSCAGLHVAGQHARLRMLRVCRHSVVYVASMCPCCALQRGCANATEGLAFGQPAGMRLSCATAQFANICRRASLCMASQYGPAWIACAPKLKCFSACSGPSLCGPGQQALL